MTSAVVDEGGGRPAFVLIPGAGGSAWYWHLLVAELAARGFDAVAVDLPAGDESAGLEEYADAVVHALAHRHDPVIVAQSLAGFTAPLVCLRVPVRMLVFLNAMIPRPGETAGEWWANTGQAEARARQATVDGRVVSEAFDVFEEFLHDVPEDVTAALVARGEPRQSGRPFQEPPPFERWPDIPIRVIAGLDDRFFPVSFQREIAEKRLGITPDVVPGGHLLALSQPAELADQLERYLAELS